ncbi:hypothetical protein [Haloferula sp. BvORR071]|uniref:hypothetical protein n=1 Tax=Haloferula sp. BvORR071 TaxID=1396141 RepID=UPI002240FB24|nr:hypothetical protein [Haloferula sp. BvORR071]
METSLYRFTWPMPYRVSAREEDAGVSAVNLTGSGGELLFIQCPRKLPPLEEMGSSDQKIVEINQTTRTVLLEYAFDRKMWRQRHTVRQVGGLDLVVSMQAPFEIFERFERDVAPVLSSLEAMRGD